MAQNAPREITLATLAPLDPQVEALLTEAWETIRNQAETIGTLTAERNEAQREARALDATMDNLTANLEEARKALDGLHMLHHAMGEVLAR